MKPTLLYKEFLEKHHKIVDAFWAWVGSSLCLLCIVLLDNHYFQAQNIDLLMASFGASAVLVFGAPSSPLAQPRNVLGGQFISAIAGVTCQLLLASHPTLAACTSVSLAIFLMTISKTLHPPGGASALLAVVGDSSIKNLGYMYAFIPCLLGAIIVVGIGIILSITTGRKKYPHAWWPQS